VENMNIGMATAIRDITDERLRQVGKEGWTAEHDDEHSNGQLAQAAACYAWAGWKPAPYWPWSRAWDKRDKHDRRRQLVIAGALIVAEIERLDRLGETASLQRR
jgi:hypothetical protein